MTSPSEDWGRVRELFEGALALPTEERLAFVAESCGGDAALQQQTAALLNSHDRAADFLEKPAGRLLGGDDASINLEGERIGPYEIGTRIGAGGMGEVYRARDTRLVRTVAIKVLPPRMARDEPSRWRFEREARAVAALNHPHICTLHDIGTHESSTGSEHVVPYLVMEYLNGETLAARLAKDPLPVPEALEYALQIVSALDSAHRAGIVHRDLKPRNIMVTTSGAKLLDFGLAKATIPVPELARTGSIHSTREASELTAAGIILGTLHYMAPEQLEGAKTDARTDLFAFGCVLYEMLTGRKAFDARSSAGLLTAILALEPATIRDHVPTVPQRVEDIIARCLAKNPDDRWQSASDLYAELKRTADAVGSSHRVRRRRGSFATLGAVVALALVLAAGVWSAIGLRTATVVSPTSVTLTQLAVLPLRMVGDAADDEHLGVGIADAIITRLATVRQIGLRPTTAVLSYADAPAGPAQVAKVLAVDHVLVGTIQRTPAAYRVTFQLVQSPAGTVAWARTYDVVPAGLLTLQDTIAEQVVEALSMELTSVERERFRRRYTENVEAYDLYLRGRASLVNYTEVGMRAAIDAFERALAIDPDYALARAGLATACAWFGIRYAYETDAFQWGERADREARAALASDPSLAEATLAIASAAGTVYGGFNWPSVIDDATRALAIDSTLDLAHVVRMRAFYHLGLFDRMADEASASRRMNPLGNVEVVRLEVAASLFAGSYDRAREQASALLARTDAPVIRNYLGLAQFYSGDVTAARETLAAVKRGGRPDVRSQAALAGVEAAAGDHAAARRRAVSIERGPYMDHHVAYSLGAVWAQLNDAKASVTWLQKAADTGFPCYPWVARDSLLDPIRRDPEFIALLERLRKRHEGDAARYVRES